MTNDERDEIIVEMHVNIEYLRKDFENHLQDHKKYMMMAWTSVIGLVITLIVLLLKG